MLKIGKMAFLMYCIFFITVLSACGFRTEERPTSDANGTVLAGEEAPKRVGILKSMESKEEVVITVEGQDVNYRLSEKAKAQVEGKEVEKGSEVTFTTFSIGDDKETIAEFVIK